jgi:DNA-binding transcriptional ArsR family regulator
MICKYYILKQTVCKYIIICETQLRSETLTMISEVNTPFELAAMQASAANACRLMKVLTNPDRLMILCQLAQGERCVSELETSLGIVQPTLSQQLTVLRNEQLVKTRREGKNIYYQFSSPQALAVMEVLYSQFCNKEGVST